MCLVIKDDHKAKIAKIDLYTIKILMKGLNSPYQAFDYKLNKLYKTKLYKNIFNQIGEGFHSLVSPYSTWKEGGLNSICELYICKIPKGSKYYLGTKFDIASNQIIILEKVWEYSKYSSTNYVNSKNAYTKAFKKLKEKYGKQQY